MIYHITDVANNIHCGDSDNLQEAIEIAKESACDGEFRVDVYHYEDDENGRIKIVNDWTNR